MDERNKPKQKQLTVGDAIKMPVPMDPNKPENVAMQRITIVKIVNLSEDTEGRERVLTELSTNLSENEIMLEGSNIADKEEYTDRVKPGAAYILEI